MSHLDSPPCDSCTTPRDWTWRDRHGTHRALVHSPFPSLCPVNAASSAAGTATRCVAPARACSSAGGDSAAARSAAVASPGRCWNGNWQRHSGLQSVLECTRGARRSWVAWPDGSWNSCGTCGCSIPRSPAWWRCRRSSAACCILTGIDILAIEGIVVLACFLVFGPSMDTRLGYGGGWRRGGER